MKEKNAAEIELVMLGILKENQAGKIKKLGAYAKTIFEEWLNGAEPSYLRVPFTKKYIFPKSASQVLQEQAAEIELRYSQDKVTAKLSKELGLDTPTVYGFLVNYGGHEESLEKLSVAVSKLERAIKRGEVDRNPTAIREALNRELKKQEISQEAVSIAQ